MLSRFLPFGFAIVLFPIASVRAAERPIVVELFTSQGCSSCPPADTYLTELSQNRPDVLALAFHVTYWNDLGWQDPFSFDAATQRQGSYGTRFGNGVYTPEIVVDGAKDVVGSNRGGVASAIERAAHESLTLASIAAWREGGQLSIQVGRGSGSGQLLLVGFDHEHRTAVGRGENYGRMLTESNVVRSIRAIGQWSGAPLQLTESFPEGEDAAVLLQTSDGRIAGASRLGNAR
jgi:hypothetical protein